MSKKLNKYLVVTTLLYSVSVCFGQIDTMIYDADAKLTFAGKILNGRKVGEWIEYGAKDIIKAKYFYETDSTFRFVRYFGMPPYKKSIEGQGLLRNGKELYHGIITSFWRSNGKISRIEHYNVDIKEGIAKWFYESGKLSIVENYKNGQLKGEYIAYHENGSIKEKGNYNCNEKVGKWTYYHPSGCKRAEGKHFPSHTEIAYSDNIVDSLRKEFLYEDFLSADGQLKTFPLTYRWKDGKWKYYNDKCVINREEIFKKGKLIKRKVLDN